MTDDHELRTFSPYFHPDDPAGWLKPGEAFIVDGTDWSWAFVWYKEVVGFSGYQVGTNGIVWSCRLPNGEGIVDGLWRKRNPGSSRGYCLYGLMDENSKQVTRLGRTLVLTTFLGHRPKGMQCCHRDGVRSNNRFSNLRWGTSKENHADSKMHGTKPIGSRHVMSKLNEIQVLEIKRLLKGGAKKAEIGRLYGVSDTLIRNIQAHKTWTHVD